MNNIARKILCVAIPVIGGGSIMAGTLYALSLITSGNKEEPLVPKEVALSEARYSISPVSECSRTLSYKIGTETYFIIDDNCDDAIDRFFIGENEIHNIPQLSYKIGTETSPYMLCNQLLKSAREALVKPEYKVTP